MEWTPEAEEAILKVPVFVRKRVGARVEKEARGSGDPVVSLTDVQTTQSRFLSGMSSELKGYQTEICFGPNGCVNRANPGDGLLEEIETLLEAEDLLTFLKDNVQGDLKYHHNFRVAISDCPNACSQPQVKDIGIIGACSPLPTDLGCIYCGVCIETCRENAITLKERPEEPDIDSSRCVMCGKCIGACPTGTISEGRRGYRVQLGGKLGRHPKLARELSGIFTEDQVLEIVKDCIRFYKKNSKQGQRFAQIFTDVEFAELENQYTQPGKAGTKRSSRKGAKELG